MYFFILEWLFEPKKWPLTTSFASIVVLFLVVYFYRETILEKIKKIIVFNLINLITVEIWYWESFGWCRYRKALRMTEWLAENGLEYMILSTQMVWKYFLHNWVVWENAEIFLPKPIVNQEEALVGQVHPLDLISSLSEARDTE